jgi:hypothetical protein
VRKQQRNPASLPLLLAFCLAEANLYMLCKQPDRTSYRHGDIDGIADVFFHMLFGHERWQLGRPTISVLSDNRQMRPWQCSIAKCHPYCYEMIAP